PSGPGMVVRTFLTRRMPSRPRVRMARSTAPREVPARPSWRRSRATHFRRPYRPSGVIWTCPVTGWVVQAKSRILSSTRASVTVAGSDAGRPLPGPVGACSDRQALLAQDAEDRLDCIALGAHLVDERQDQRLRGSSSPAKKIEAR